MAKSRTKTRAEVTGDLLLKRGAQASYKVSNGRGKMVNKSVTIMAHIPAGQSLQATISKLPRKFTEGLTPKSIERIGEATSERNRYLVFWEKHGKLACPPAITLNRANI
jgi:hypothetical protein